MKMTFLISLIKNTLISLLTGMTVDWHHVLAEILVLVYRKEASENTVLLHIFGGFPTKHGSVKVDPTSIP